MPGAAPESRGGLTSSAQSRRSRACRHGPARVVWIQGEAGSGKTALLRPALGPEPTVADGRERLLLREQLQCVAD